MDPFDFGRFFRGFLGLGKRDEEVYSPIQRYNDREGDEIYQQEERGQEGDPNQNFFHFRVCTDPLEIHKFFEREMEQMFKEFGGLGGIMGQQKMLEDFPSRIEELPDAGSQTDRDLMLKSDSELISPKFGGRIRDEIREDTDLDGENISSDQLYQLLKDKENPSIDSGRYKHSDDRQRDGSHFGGGFGSPGSGFHSYSFSRSIRTVQKPDGTIETEERTRNPDGTESVIIKRRVGSQEETIHQDGALVPYSDAFPPHHQLQPNLPSLFGHLFPGMLGRDGPANGRDEMLPHAPPSDRMFSSLFSQFFGDQRR